MSKLSFSGYNDISFFLYHNFYHHTEENTEWPASHFHPQVRIETEEHLSGSPRFLKVPLRWNVQSANRRAESLILLYSS